MVAFGERKGSHRGSLLSPLLSLSLTLSSSVFAKWSLLAGRKQEIIVAYDLSFSIPFFSLAQPELTFHHRLCLTVCDVNCTALLFTRGLSSKVLAQKLQDTNGTVLKCLTSFWPPLWTEYYWHTRDTRQVLQLSMNCSASLLLRWYGVNDIFKDFEIYKCNVTWYIYYYSNNRQGLVW